jgi:hypothetical protein
MTTTPATEIEPVLAGALALLQAKPDISLDELAAQVVAAVPAAPAAEAEPFPKLPKTVELTDEVRRALKNVASIFNSVVIKDRRSLTKDELDLLTMEQGVIILIGATLIARQEAIKETIRHHMDVDAEEQGLAVPKDKLGPDGEVIVAATPRDQHGHYLLATSGEPHQVQCGPVLWSQEASSATPKPNDSALQAGFRAGTISREDYLAVSREVRVFDPEKARALVRKEPARGLAVLRQVTVGGKPKSSLYLREVK